MQQDLNQDQGGNRKKVAKWAMGQKVIASLNFEKETFRRDDE
jgi:hypothetical protein